MSTGAQKRRRPASQLDDDSLLVPEGDPHREYREKRSRRLILDFLVFLGISAVVSLIAVVVLWQLGVFGSGKWDQSSPSNVVFVDSLQSLNKLLDNTTVPHVIAIYSESCPSCKRMRAPFLKVAESFAGEPARFLGIKAENHEFAELFTKWDVTVVPTVAYLPPAAATPKFYKDGASESALGEFVAAQLRKTDASKT